jgi:hypothetical protein
MRGMQEHREHRDLTWSGELTRNWLGSSGRTNASRRGTVDKESMNCWSRGCGAQWNTLRPERKAGSDHDGLYIFLRSVDFINMTIGSL